MPTKGTASAREYRAQVRRDTQCGTKFRYITRPGAVDAEARLRADHPDYAQTFPYRCDFCDGYHLSRQAEQLPACPVCNGWGMPSAHADGDDTCADCRADRPSAKLNIPRPVMVARSRRNRLA